MRKHYPVSIACEVLEVSASGRLTWCSANSILRHPIRFGVATSPTVRQDSVEASGLVQIKSWLGQLMPKYRSLEFGIYAIYPTRRYVPPKVRVLIDYLSSAMQSFN